MVMFDLLLLFVCLFIVVVVVVVVAAAAAAAVVVSVCFNMICDTFIHLVENQYLQTLRNIGNLQTQFWVLWCLVEKYRKMLRSMTAIFLCFCYHFEL